MNKLNAFLVTALATAALNAAVIEQVIVRQQWPWSTDVKIEYKLADVSAPVDISVEAYNGDEKLDQTRLDESLSGDRFGMTDVVGTIILDPVKAFGTEKVALANFKVKLSLSDSAANMREILYRVFTIATGESEFVRRCDLLNGKYGDYETVGDTLVWTSLTNGPKYKTSHLVMRRIPAEGQVWNMGAAKGDAAFENREYLHSVKFTQDYYMGVFPVTQAQWTGIMGETTFAFGDFADSGSRPAESITYRQMRAAPTADTTPEAASFVYKLSDRMKASFDLPTDAQWEYACRAGVYRPLYSGYAYSETEVKKLGWVKQNSDQMTHEVGLKLPNNWGLYDLVGNVKEVMLDWYSDSDAYAAYIASEEPPMVNPIGSRAVSNTYRVYRGGSWEDDGGQGRSSFRYTIYVDYGNTKSSLGLRLCLPAEQ